MKKHLQLWFPVVMIPLYIVFFFAFFRQVIPWGVFFIPGVLFGLAIWYSISPDKTDDPNGSDPENIRSWAPFGLCIAAYVVTLIWYVCIKSQIL